MNDNNIKLSVLPSSSTNVIHAALFVGDMKRDIGTLYMTQEEYDTLTKVLRTGCVQESVSFDHADERSYDYDY